MTDLCGISSTATTLALHALSINPLVQKRLREELFSVASDAPSFDELNSLPLLENFVRETMCLYPPVAFTMREAMMDDILPLSRQYLDRHGRAYNTIGYGAMLLFLNIHSRKVGQDA
jgi:hypothetical protein